jgi:NADPH:quinone reductase-like Zn-dependent oxidoreductase
MLAGVLTPCAAMQGQYQDKPKLPFIPGSEVSGTVLEVGSKVKHVKPGDQVCVARPFCMSQTPLQLLKQAMRGVSPPSRCARSLVAAHLLRRQSCLGGLC